MKQTLTIARYKCLMILRQIDLLRNSGFVDFRDYFGLFSTFFAGVISTRVYDPREKNRKVGSKEPENQQNLRYARGLKGIYFLPEWKAGLNSIGTLR